MLSSEVDLATKQPALIPLAQARTMILAALQPLGADYTKRMGDLLNPENGRLDLAGGLIGLTPEPLSMLLLRRRRSITVATTVHLGGVSVIAHEGGHTIHRELMNAGGSPIYAHSGPNYLFEGFAIFNELLVADYAAKTAPTPQEKQYALERLLAELSVELFVSAEETDLERNLYRAASGKALLDRAQVDTIYRDSIAPYGYWPITDVGQSRGWMRKSLLLEDPLYLVNYLYASVVAVALYDKAHSDPDFASKYEALLRGGFVVDPKDMLASLGIYLDDPNLVKPAARLLQEKTAELKQLYTKNKLQ